jgi:hypothetical protein
VCVDSQVVGDQDGRIKSKLGQWSRKKVTCEARLVMNLGDCLAFPFVVAAE